MFNDMLDQVPWKKISGTTTEALMDLARQIDAGKEFLQLVSNTWFQKKDIYKRTWQHPKSNK